MDRFEALANLQQKADQQHSAENCQDGARSIENPAASALILSPVDRHRNPQAVISVRSRQQHQCLMDQKPLPLADRRVVHVGLAPAAIRQPGISRNVSQQRARFQLCGCGFIVNLQYKPPKHGLKSRVDRLTAKRQS